MEISLVNTQKSEIFSAIFQHLKIFTEHVNIQFNEEGVYVQGMDSSHVSIYELSIPAAWFDQYTCSVPSSLGINTNIFFKILNAREKTQEIRIAATASEDDKVLVHFVNGKDKNDFDRHFEMPLVDVTSDILSIPEIEYQAEFTLSAAKMASVISQLRMFGDTMDILCSEESIKITSDSNNAGKMIVEINIGELTSYSIEEGREIKLAYSLAYMGNICLFHKLAKEVELAVSEDYPMKMSYDMGDGANMKFYLAPKMTSDD